MDLTFARNYPLHLVSSTVVLKLRNPVRMDFTGGEIMGKDLNPRFKARKVKLKKGTGLVFESGKVVLVGVVDITNAVVELSQVLLNAIMGQPMIKNLVFRSYLPNQIDLPATCRCFHSTKEWLASYEPELFPALVANKKNENAKLQYFTSGKIIITGVLCAGRAVELLDSAHLLIVQK